MKRLLPLAFCALLLAAWTNPAFAGDPPQDTVKKEKTKAKAKKNSKGADAKGDEAGMIISEKGQPTERPKGTKAGKTAPAPSTDSKTGSPK